MSGFDLRAVIRPDLLSLPGYAPIEPPDVLADRLGVGRGEVIKLDGNENPYGPSPRALEAIASERDYHIYPDPEQRAVRTALARYTGAPAESIVCGLGSDDLIDLVLRAVIAPGEAVIVCPPTFGMYEFSAQVAGGRVIEARRREDFALDLDAIGRQAAGAKAMFLASPNNPTGNSLSHAEVEAVLALPLLVVVDEAYIEFAGTEHSLSEQVARRENLVVLRTFSKWAGLAGLRAGYGIMPPLLASVLMTIKQPYNLNVAAGVAMRAALEERAVLMQRVCAITETCGRLARELAGISWLEPYPSDANFVLCRLDGVDAREVKERLAARGIFVRHFDTPLLRNHLRISAGLEEHVAPLVAALREIGAELGR
jgi:histidinol-phosphate aminotransferase